MFLELNFALRLALIVILAVGTVIATNRGLQYGLLLAMITGLFGMRGMLIWGMSLPNLTMDRVVWAALLLVFLVMWRRGKIKSLTPDLAEYAMLALLIVILVSTYVHESYLAEWSTGEKFLFGAVVQAFFLPFVTYAIARRGIHTINQMHSLLVGVGLISIYLGITSLGEASGADWLVYPKYILDPTQGIHFGKARGIFLSGSVNGLAMGMTLPLLFWLWVKDHSATQWLWLMAIAVVGLAIIPTFERSSWLGAVGALGVMVIFWQKRRFLTMGAITFAVAIWLLAAPDSYIDKIQEKIKTQETIDFRIDMINTSIEMIRTHPVTGVGFNRFEEETSNYGMHSWGAPSHNLPLTLFAELGLLGFLSYLAIFAGLFVMSLELYRHQPRYRLEIALVWATTATYFVSLMSIDTSNAAFPNILYFALWGAILGAVRKQTVFRKMGDKRRAIVSFV